MGPLDPRVEERQIFLTPFNATHAKKPCLFTEYTGPLDPQQDLTTQKVRVANKKS